MVQAAAAAGVDFSQYDQRDDKWQRRLIWIVQEYDRQNEIAYYESYARRLTGLAPITAKESIQKLGEVVQSIGNALDRLYHPEQEHLSETEEKRRRTAVDKDAWQSKFGQLDDPETQQKIERFAAGMQLLMEATEKKSRMDAPFGRHMQRDKEVAMMRGPARDA